jgi:small subunit ribosomal protein S7
MPRKKRVLKRPQILADKTFGSVLVSRLINRVMWDGKKTIATRIVSNALVSASEELNIAPIEVLEVALDNVKPQVEVKSMRVGGANYQVPIEPRPERALRLGLTWITNSARAIKGRPMEEKLKEVLVQSYQSQGPAVSKRNSVHQTAAGNKAFAHFASRGAKKKQ